MGSGRFDTPPGSGRRRVDRVLAALVVSAACLGGCTRQPPLVDQAATFRLGSQSTAEAAVVLTEFLYAESLIVIDWHGRPTARLATEWHWLDEGRALALKLRPGVKFHDGEPLTSGIVARIMRQHVKANDGQVFRYVTDIETPDPQTLILRLSRPDAFLVEALANSPIFDEQKPDIGTGPFRIASRTPVITAASYGDYYRGAPGLDRIEIVTFDTQRAVFAGMMRGQLEMVQEVNPESVEFLEGAARFETFSTIRPYYIPLVFNLKHPILRHVEVRRAIAEAIDREEIVAQAMRGRAQVADDPVWPFHWAYNGTARRHTYNPNAARAQLDAAGLQVRPPTAVGRMASRFQLRCLFYNKDFQFERIALLLQRQLDDVGIDLVLEGLDQDQIVKRIFAGDFDSYVFQMGAGKSFNWTYRFWHSPPASGGGYTGVDDVLDRLRVARTDADIRIGVADLRQRFYDDVPAAFLAWPEATRAVDTRFDIGDRSNPDIFANIWQWRPAVPQKAER